MKYDRLITTLALLLVFNATADDWLLIGTNPELTTTNRTVEVDGKTYLETIERSDWWTTTSQGDQAEAISTVSLVTTNGLVRIGDTKSVWMSWTNTAQATVEKVLKERHDRLNPKVRWPSDEEKLIDAIEKADDKLSKANLEAERHEEELSGPDSDGQHLFFQLTSDIWQYGGGPVTMSFNPIFTYGVTNRFKVEFGLRTDGVVVWRKVEEGQ